MRTQFESIEEVVEFTENWDGSEWVDAHNTYCIEHNMSDDEIFVFDEEFFDTFFDGRPLEAARATHFGEINWSDDYVTFNGYGNLKSINKWGVENEIDKEAIIEDIFENPDNYNL